MVGFLRMYVVFQLTAPEKRALSIQSSDKSQVHHISMVWKVGCHSLLTLQRLEQKRRKRFSFQTNEKLS
jgi:hypothetical protein